MDKSTIVTIIISVITAIVVLLITGFLKLINATCRGKFDEIKVCKWLKNNTRDKAGESHVDLMAIVKGTGLPDDRVRRACMTCKNIYHYPNKEQWSIWRKEPQSVYEGLTKDEIIDRMGF